MQTSKKPKKHNSPKIPNPALRGQRLLDDKVALVDKEEDESNPHFKISYQYYNSSLCEIDNLSVSSARKCLTKLKHFGQSNNKTLCEKNILPRPVHNRGSYKALFSKLSDDVDLFEIDLGEASRLFYFTVGHLLHIVSIKNSHIKC
jgi:hypothetical protein